MLDQNIQASNFMHIYISIYIRQNYLVGWTLFQDVIFFRSGLNVSVVFLGFFIVNMHSKQ